MVEAYCGFSTPEEVESLLQDLLKAQIVAFDIETDTDYKAKGWPTKDFGLSFVADPVVVSFAWKSNDTGEQINSLTFGYEDLESPAYKTAVNHLLSKARLIIAHNAVFDLRQIAGKLKFGGLTNGYIHGQVWDTLANARVLHPEKQQFFGMPFVAKALGLSMSEEHLAAKDKRSEGHEVDQLAFMKYCESDTILTYQMYEEQLKLVDSEQLFSLIEWENRASRAYSRLSARGVRLNSEYVKQRIVELEEVVANATTNLVNDGLLEPSKRLQVAEYLYVKKKLPLPPFDLYSMFYTDKAKKEANNLILSFDKITVRVVHTPKGITPTKTFEKKRLAAIDQGVEAYAEFLEKNGYHSEHEYMLKVNPPVTPLGEFTLEGKSGYGQETTVEWDLSYFSLSSSVMIAYLGDTEEIGEFDGIEEGDTTSEESGVFKDKLKAMADYVTSSRMLTTLKMLLLHASYDGRIHSLVSVATATGRRASQHPQVQNWHLRANEGDPAGDMCGVAIADDNGFLGEWDFNNAENRIAAVLAADSKLAEACMSKDFHAFCAAGYFGEKFTSLEPKSDAWNHLRDMSKKITFGAAYGMGATKLAAGLEISLEEAQDILAAKDQAYAKVAATKKRVQQVVLERAQGSMYGYINLWSGRKVPVSVQKAYKSWNYGCQGGVGEMLKRSLTVIMETLDDLGLRSYPALDMHDAVIVNVYLDEYEVVSKLVSDTMQTILPEIYNKRTTPNMAWIADVDLKKNAKKWGKFQPHPNLPKEEVKAASEPKPSPFKNKDFIKIGYEGEGAGDHKLALYDLDYVVPLSYAPFTALQEMTPEQIEETKAAINGAVKVIETALNAPYRVQVPLDGNGDIYALQDGSGIYRSDVLNVSIDDWCNVPNLWVSACELAGVDPVTLTKKSATKLSETAKERGEWVSSLRTRLMYYHNQQKQINNYLEGKPQEQLLAS